MLDTSIVLAALDQKDALHDAATAQIRLRRDQGAALILPVVAFGEALVGSTRLGDAHAAMFESRIDRLVNGVHLVDRPIARAAATVRAERISLKMPDALVIATGRVIDASVILTGDKRWAGIDRRVEVVAA